MNSHRTPAGLLKVDASGAPVWGTLLSEGSPHLQLLGAPAQNRKIYTYGYDDGSQLYPAPAYLARYSQGGRTQLKITLGSLLVSPAAPPTISGVSLAGNSSTNVEIDLVDSAGNPLAQQTAVNVSVSVTAFSGGHAHDNARPVGTLSGPGVTASNAVAATTNAGGQLFLTYTSTSVGGQETITAALATDPSVSSAAVVNVGVVDTQGQSFIDLWVLPVANLTGNTLPTTYGGCSGYSTTHHPSNHWARADTIARAVAAITEFYAETGITLGVNDMSLPDGGMFDICGDWQLVPYKGRVKGHLCHRGGNSVDINRSLADGTKLSEAQIDVLTALMSQYGGQKVNEGPIHFQFPGSENCFGTGGP